VNCQAASESTETHHQDLYPGMCLLPGKSEGWEPRPSESCNFHSLMIHFKLLEKQEQDKPQIGRWKEIIKIRAKNNEGPKKLYRESMNQKIGSGKR
jgi:hypothetical protein